MIVWADLRCTLLALIATARRKLAACVNEMAWECVSLDAIIAGGKGTIVGRDSP